MDPILSYLVAASVLIVVAVSFFGWDRHLGRRTVELLRIVGRLFGLAALALGVAALVAYVSSRPWGQVSGSESAGSLVWVVPLLLINSGASYLLGLEMGASSPAAWLRRFGWAGTVLTLQLTAVSDLALIVAIVAVPTLLRLPTSSTTDPAPGRPRDEPDPAGRTHK